MALIRWKKQDPFFGALFNLEDEISRMFDFSLPMSHTLEDVAIFGHRWSPAVDISEDKDNIYVKAELPGLKQEEIKVSLHDDLLTITGERKVETEAKKKHFYRVERAYGSFQRAIRLPSGVDEGSIKASYKQGILDITLPKKEEAKKKQIDIDIK